MRCPYCNAEFEIEWKTNEEIKDTLAEQRDIDLEEGSVLHNHIPQHQEQVKNLSKSCDVEKGGFSPTRTGDIKSSGVEDHLPNIELSPEDTSLPHKEDKF